MIRYLRAYCERTESLATAEPGTPIRFIASTDGIKRDGKDLHTEDWRLDNFKRNPVFLWVHDYGGRTLPIGRVPAISIEGRQLVADVQFDQADEFARQVESKYRRGFLNAVSVGWADVAEGKRTWHDLMDVSGVPVPADPDALKLEQARVLRQMLQDLESSRAITDSDQAALERELRDLPMRDLVATHRRLHMYAAQGNLLTGFSKADMEWLHAACERELERRAKEEGREPSEPSPLEWGGGAAVEGAPDDQDERWLPATIGKIKKKFKKSAESAHERMSDAPVWGGVSSAMLDVFLCHDAMEDEKRRALYNVLERAYRRLDKVPPEWMSHDELAGLGPDEIVGLFLEGEERAARVGAVLSKRNGDKLRQAAQLIAEVLASAEKEPPDESGDDGQNGDAQRSAATLVEIHKLFQAYGGTA